MNFKKYETKGQFLEENLEILLKEEAKNEIMIGILLEHDEAKVKNWTMGRIEDNGEVKLIFLVDDDRQGLLVYSLEELLSDEVVNCLVDNIINLNVKLKDVLTSKECAIKIANLYSQKTGVSMTIDQYMYILILDEYQNEYLLSDGERLEKLENDEKYLKILEPNIKEMYADNFRGKYCSDEDATRVAKIFLKKGIYVLKNQNGEIVSQAVTVRKQINGCALGGVITLKEHREHGYAKRAVYTICDMLLKQGYKYVVLHVNSLNEPAISLYNKIGFKKIDETAKIKFAYND